MHFPVCVQVKSTKDGQKMGVVRESPTYTQAKSMKDGERVEERWDKPGKAHPMPRQRV